MRRSRFTLISILALAFFSLTAPARVRSQTAADWPLLAPAGEGFSARMPVKPEVEKSTYPTEGEHYRSHMYTAVDRGNGQFYIIAMTEFPKVVEALDSTARIEQFMTGFWPSFKQSLTASMATEPTVELKLERELTLKGRGGRQYSIAINQLKGLVRAYDGVSRMYILLVIGGDEKNAGVNRFLNSFDFRPAPAPVAQQIETKPAPSSSP